MVVDRSSPSRILVIDDELFARLQLCQNLQRDNHQVMEAETAMAALAWVDRQRPDLVVLSTSLPDLDGLTCCRQLKAKLGHPDVPVFLLTSVLTTDLIDQALAAGAEDITSKPVHWELLRQRIRLALDRSHLRQQVHLIQDELARLTAIDPVTQLANRRRFEAVLDLEWRRLAREVQPLTLALCTIDDLAAYRSTFGDAAADHRLQQVARLLVSIINRPADLIARYDETTFGLLLPNTNAVGAACLSARLCEAMRSLAQSQTSRSGSALSLSIGTTAIVPLADTKPEEPIARAHHALALAQATPGNCYRTDFGVNRSTQQPIVPVASLPVTIENSQPEAIKDAHATVGRANPY